MQTRNKVLVGLQHALSMAGATLLVPLLTGFPVSIALFASGMGTLIFHYITKEKVPAYLGSSFAFIAPLSLVVAEYGGVSSALGGIIYAGIVYLIFGLIIKKSGKKIIKKMFPPIITGSVIMLIGLSLAPVAIDQIGTSPKGLLVALVTFTVAILTILKGKGLIKILPVLTGLTAGYFLSLLLGMVDTSVIGQANVLGLPAFQLPTFNLNAILIIAPVAIVTVVEHIGDILAIGETTGKNVIDEPGIHKTLMGDGLATMFAGLVGGVPNTTYGENIGVLNLTKVYNSKVVQIGAVVAIIASFIPKIEGVLMSIPEPVLGGISILLFGMIASVGIRTLIKESVDLYNSRNLVIISSMLVIGLGDAVINIGVVEVSSIALASIVGIILNLVLPEVELKNE